MKKIIKLGILSMILLVSMSGIVLGAIGNIAVVGTTGNVAITEPADTTTITETPVDTSVPTDTYPSTPQIPATTPKSPGFEFVVSAIVLLSAIYIIRRR